MTTVIVPVDFSETSIHAAKYAAQLLVGHYGITLILYHSYDEENDEALGEKNLQDLKAELMEHYIVKIETLNHREPNFVEGIEKAIRHRSADLVIMGSSGKSAFEHILFGSNTLKTAATKACPVLIIPPQAPFRPVKNVMLTSDFKNTAITTPSVPIKNILNQFKPTLHVINVDKDHYISLTENYEKEKQDLKKMFDGYNPEFYFMRLYEIDEAVNMFAEDKDIDMIIAIQKNHSFIEGLFHTSRTKKLSLHSKVPFLIIHE
jgi:nucleotide-binding universal stress UspA family protein